MGKPPQLPQNDGTGAAEPGRKPPPALLHAAAPPAPAPCWRCCTGFFDITILYYNPNIWPASEYRRRADELHQFVKQANLPGITLVEEGYDQSEFYTAVAGLEAEPERGGRCTVCYRLRMEHAAKYAAANGFDWFCSTLSISPRKDAEKINAIGRELEAKYGVRHLPNEFKRKEGHKRSLELSAQYSLYRQDWCGCEFSARGSAPKPEQPAPEK